MTDSFTAGQIYDHVYMIFVDASGHSSIVASNPRDRSEQAFDLLQERIVARISKTAAARRCARAVSWGWQGDGGLFVIHDDNESVACDVALDSAKSLLSLDLRHLQDEFTQLGVRGELHLRIAVHKGSLRYLGDSLQGSIHSPDINFAAHLEKATPRDMVAISADVYNVSGAHASTFDPVGAFEGREVYLLGGQGGSANARRSWLAARGPAGAVEIGALYERPSQHEKAKLVDAAAEEIVDLGTALNTCSNYLVTTERPARYRDAVLEFLARGGTFRCVLMDPSCEATRLLSARRSEDLFAKITRSIDAFGRFLKKYPQAVDHLQVYAITAYPGMASFAVDPNLPGGMVLYSPYVEPVPLQEKTIDRGDMPHYFVSARSGALFETIKGLVNIYSSPEVAVRIL